jgi:hypothetical protein
VSDASLSWHVPHQADPALLRVRLAQVGLASLVAALILLVAARPPWREIGLVGLVPLALLMACRHWHRHQQQWAGPPNLRLDARGLHWLDASGTPHLIPRHQVQAFRIGRDAQTLRSVPALTLHLTGGFESQPIELYPPATPEAVRDLLVRAWGLVEHPDEEPSGRPYDLAVDVYSECHPEQAQWHFEGTAGALAALFAEFDAVARELPLPPPGARPLTRVILARRRCPTRLVLGHAPLADLSDEQIFAPGDVLRCIAQQAQELLDDAESPCDRQCDIRVAPHEVWTFHLHVRPQPPADGRGE